MRSRSPRLAVRALIVQNASLLLVNAFPAVRGSDLWCAPGGGVERGQSLPNNLQREVFEETGLRISVGELALVNEFHDPNTSFHQVDLFFRCQITDGRLDPGWKDPENVVNARRFFTRKELVQIRLKPDSLPAVAFDGASRTHYDPLEPIIF